MFELVFNQKFSEIIRFILVGILSTIIDFAFYTLTSFCLQKVGLQVANIWCTVISTTIGFIFGVVVNYILSTIWVYKNYDKKGVKEHRSKHVLVFVILSAIGMFIGIGIMAIFKIAFKNGLNVDIDTWMNINMPIDLPLFPKLGYWLAMVLSSLVFWLFFISFAIKTCITLSFNYITRKKLLFKTFPSDTNQNLIRVKKEKVDIKQFLFKHRYILVFVLLFAVYFTICCVKLGDFRIIKWDEARHAISAYEMIKRNDYLVNTYLWQPD